MSTGRTHYKYVRCYGNGVDISGYARSTGELGTTHQVQLPAILYCLAATLVMLWLLL